MSAAGPGSLSFKGRETSTQALTGLRVPKDSFSSIIPLIMSLAPGTKLGPYEIVSALGAGGMGEVYRAKDTRLGRDVAVKILPKEMSTDAARKQRFEREAKTISGLNHPNICTLHDVGCHDGLDYLVMECVEGESLAQRLRRGPLPLKETVRIAMDVCDALDIAHRAGIMHRDLKPGNIMLTKTGAKLLDFGLAKPAAAMSGATLTAMQPMQSPVTQEGTIVGTFQYMSPEQIEGKEMDGRSDIFSLGAVLYEMVTGKKAFEGKSQLSVASAILEKEPEPISSIQKLTPRVLERVVNACLKKDPEERYQSARDVKLDLNWVGEESSQASSQRAATLGNRWRRVLPWAIAGVALIVGGLGTWRHHGGRGVEEMPRYHQLTFERGLIYAARFAADGRSVVYSASWEGQPVQIYSTDPGSPESRPLNLVNSTLFAASGGELAISLGCNDVFIGDCVGTLARVPISGGAPREIAEGVLSADWTTDGNELAAIRSIGAKYRVEYPLGHAIYESNTPLLYLRVAPGGQAVAFAQLKNTGGDIGRVVVVNKSGKEVAHTETFLSVEGLAWSPTGEEVWIGAATDEAWANAIHALRLNGERRIVLLLPGVLRLHDVSRTGRVLLSKETWRNEMRFCRAGAEKDRSLSWLDYALVRDISPDGKTISFDEAGEAGGVATLGYVRATDGSPAIKLGSWYGLSLAPDGKKLLAIDGSAASSTSLAIVPIGAGETQMLSSNGMQSVGSIGWMPDGREIWFIGDNGHGWRVYLQDLVGGAPRAVTPGISVNAGHLDAHIISPDGKQVFARDLTGKGKLYPLVGGDAKEIQGWLPQDIWVTWSKDGREAYVYNDEKTFATIYRLDLTNGKRQSVGTLFPPEPAGVTAFTGVQCTPDGKTYAYSYQEQRSDLFLVEGVR